VEENQTDGNDNFCHNVVVEEGTVKLNISCQHLEFALYQNESTCPVDMLTSKSPIDIITLTKRWHQKGSTLNWD